MGGEALEQRKLYTVLVIYVNGQWQLCVLIAQYELLSQLCTCRIAMSNPLGVFVKAA